MFNATLTPIARYRHLAADASVAEANPRHIVLLLHDAAIVAVLQARHAIERGDMAAKADAIGKAMRIVDEGLSAPLDARGSPQLAQRLRSLYDHMLARLLVANVHSADDALAEVAALLGQLRSSWSALDPVAAAAREQA